MCKICCVYFIWNISFVEIASAWLCRRIIEYFLIYYTYNIHSFVIEVYVDDESWSSSPKIAIFLLTFFIQVIYSSRKIGFMHTYFS